MDSGNDVDSSNFQKISFVANEQEDSSSGLGVAEQVKGPYREQDIYLPIANIARIMKNAVPPSGKIAKDAKECVQECVSEFISFITSEASERCAQEKRKTINGEDVLFAMSTLGFDPYIPPLKVYLQKYRDTLKAEKTGNYTEATENTSIPDSDLVDPFAPSHQFHEILGTTAENPGVFSTQMEGNLVIVEEESEEEDLDGEPIYSIFDEQIQDKARQTLPKVLCIASSSDDPSQVGVFASCPVSYRTQFGPLDAPLVPAYSLPPTAFLLKSKVKCPDACSFSLENFLYFNTSDEKMCNWMSLVRPARNFEEQNLIAHLVKDNLYFTTTRCVDVNEELKVWYAPKYASFVGKNVWTPAREQNLTLDDDCNCIRAHNKSSKSPSYDYFEEDHGLDVRCVPPKKRGWKRANHQINKINDKPDGFTMSSFEAERAKVDQVPATVVNISVDIREPASGRHLSTSNNIKQNRIFPCTECGKVFYKKFTLKMHLATHSTVRNFLCHACGKGFKRSDKLKDHIKRVHRENKIRKNRVPPFLPRVQPQEIEKFLYKCLKCSLGFIRRGMLVNHMLKQHPEQDIKSIPELSIPIFKNDISFSCLYCDKSYKSNSKRKRHIEKHHPGQIVPPDSRKTRSENDGISSKGYVTVKPVLCPHCPSQYTSKSKMLKHVQSKHNSKLSDITFPKDKTNLSPATEINSSSLFTEDHLQIHPIEVPSNKRAASAVRRTVEQPPSLESLTHVNYSGVDNIFWSVSTDSQFQPQSITPNSTVLAMCDFSDASFYPQTATNSVLNIGGACNFSPQIANYITSQSNTVQYVQESTAASNPIQPDSKLSAVEESYEPPSDVSSTFTQPSSTVHYIPSDHNETNKTLPAVQESYQPPSNTPPCLSERSAAAQHMLPPSQIAGDRPVSNSGEDVQKNQSCNFQKNVRQLPLTYTRGRKQLLLPFCNDRLRNQFGCGTRQIYPTSDSTNEIRPNSCRTNALNSDVADNQQSGVLVGNQYTNNLSPAQPAKQPSTSQSTCITQLSYQDVNWM